MTPARIRIAVAGLGRIGWRFHCAQLSAHRDYRLVAVADTEPERRAEAQDQLGAAAYADYYDMLDGEQLDAVVIATPTHLHQDMAFAAFDKGLHVVLEKPMAASLSAARRIVRKAERAGLKLTVYQPHRLMAYFQHLQRLLQSGLIGPVYWVERGMFNYARRDDWQSLRRFGGGMLNNYGAHAIDQVLNLIGYDVKRVFGDLMLAASLGDADDVVKVLMETRKGALGEVCINQASVIKPYELIAWGLHGAIEYGGGRFRVRRFDPVALPDKKLDRSLASADRQYPSDDIEFIEEEIPVDENLLVDLYKDFARAIRRDAPPLVEPWQTLAVMRVLDRARTSSGSMRNWKR